MAHAHAKSDDWSFPGLEVSHDMAFVLFDWSSWSAFENELQDKGGRVHALSMRRQSDGVMVHCRIKGVSAHEARQIGAWLSARTLAQNVSVEHLMLSPGAGS